MISPTHLSQPILPPRPPWLAFGVAGAAVGVGLFAVRSRVPPPWSVLLEPIACAAHAVAVSLGLGLLIDAARRRRWGSQLGRVGDDSGRPNWAAAAVAQTLAQFNHLPHPDEVRAKLAACSAAWEERMEARANLYLTLAFLVGLPLQIMAIQQIAEAKDPGQALRGVAIPLAAGGLEVLAVALPAYLIGRSWRELFADWRWRVAAEENYRRFDPTAPSRAALAASRHDGSPSLDALPSSSPARPAAAPPRDAFDRGGPSVAHSPPPAAGTPLDPIRPTAARGPADPWTSAGLDEDDDLAPAR